MGFLGLGYRRPAQVDKRRDTPDSTDESFGPGSFAAPAGIPGALTFDRIIDGGTCPPCTVRDFMNYLVYVEKSAENLQFFLWLRDYGQRFNSTTTSNIALSPEWAQEEQKETFEKLQKEHRDGLKRDSPATAAIFKGTDFEMSGRMSPSSVDRPRNNPFNTPPRTPNGDAVADFAGQNAMSYRSKANEAFAWAGTKAPFTIQPFREEIDRVIVTYVMDGAPRQLNLSARERKQLLIALSRTTHPTAFRQVAWSVESTLRMQSHPNFIRWSICNGNPARVRFANLLGAFLITGSLVAFVLLTLSSVPRGLRAIPAAGLFLGVSTQVAALKGMCVVLHGMHHQHVRPWELFVDEEMRDDMSAVSCSCKPVAAQQQQQQQRGNGLFESFGSSNSYEDEPWVVRYQKRNVVRKVFDREVWIEEPALRGIQDTIFIQAMLVALVSAGALAAVFVCVPGGFLY